jgi:hypothetical protein
MDQDSLTRALLTHAPHLGTSMHRIGNGGYMAYLDALTVSAISAWTALTTQTDPDADGNDVAAVRAVVTRLGGWATGPDVRPGPWSWPNMSQRRPSTWPSPLG